MENGKYFIPITEKRVKHYLQVWLNFVFAQTICEHGGYLPFWQHVKVLNLNLMRMMEEESTR